MNQPQRYKLPEIFTKIVYQAQLMLFTHTILGRNNHVIIFYPKSIENLVKISSRFEVPNYGLVKTNNLKP